MIELLKDKVQEREARLGEAIAKHKGIIAALHNVDQKDSRRVLDLIGKRRGLQSDIKSIRAGIEEDKELMQDLAAKAVELAGSI